MVVFTCNNCGETLQKPKVAKHYEFQCHSAPFLTCVDCFKDFRGEEYVAHTKCITEAERYGGKDYVPKAGANKGEKKQQEWINIVNNVLNSDKNLSNEEKSFLSVLSKYENIPRKKAKFLNFIRSAMGQRIRSSIVESVWGKMEAAYKNTSQNTTTKQPQANGKVDEAASIKKQNEHQENNVIENQNNENIDKEIQNGNQQTKSNGSNDVDDNNRNGTVNNAKKKKPKKRTLSETVEAERENPSSAQKEKHVEVTDTSVIKKKRKRSMVQEQTPAVINENAALLESSVNQSDDVKESSFNWKDTILEIVKSKEEISLKKLQKKVISQYMKSCSDTVTQEKATSKFNKKLKKVSEVVVSDDKVKLA